MTATAVSVAPHAGLVDDLRLSGPIADLVELWRRVDALVNLPDADGLSGNRALEAATLIAKVRHASDALMAPYAARLEELSDPALEFRYARWKGFPNAAALLSAATGLSVADAGKLIGLGRTLADAEEAVDGEPMLALVPVEPAMAGEPAFAGDHAAPLVSQTAPPLDEVTLAGAPLAPMPLSTPRPEPSPLAAAIRAGNLGTEKLTVIRRTLDDMTTRRREAEARLVARAASLSITVLRRLCLETFAELDPEGYAARERTQYRDRFLSIREEIDGMVSFYAKLPPAMAAPAKAWFEAEMQSAVSAQRDATSDEQRTLGQILADAFVSTVMHAAGCERATTRPQSTFVIRATKSSLEAGNGFATCDGIEAPVTIAASLAVAADIQFVGLLTDDEGVPLRLGRTSRLATSAQRLAVAERDRGCAKCSRAISKANFHHVVTWENDGPTDERNLVMLCVGCHHQIHDNGWGVVIDRNQVWFIPPAKIDPRRRRQPGSSARLAA